MTLITLRNFGVTLGAPLFSALNLVVNAGDRIGLVAANGRQDHPAALHGRFHGSQRRRDHPGQRT
jgi:hypothetical protein